MSVQGASKAVARALAARTVHMKVYPTPSTFSERREVLRVLEQFGEVTMFRSLKWHPRKPVHNSFLAMFQLETTADRVIKTSPLRFRIVPEPLPSVDSLEDSQEATLPTPEKMAGKNLRFKAESDAKEERLFQINISTTNFDHYSHISTQPLYGPYEPVRKEFSYMSQLIQRQMVQGVGTRGLADWETDALKWRTLAVNTNEDKDEDGEMWSIAKSSGDIATARLEIARRRQREKSIIRPVVMSGLRQLVEERAQQKTLNGNTKG